MDVVKGGAANALTNSWVGSQAKSLQLRCMLPKLIAGDMLIPFDFFDCAGCCGVEHIYPFDQRFIESPCFVLCRKKRNILIRRFVLWEMVLRCQGGLTADLMIFAA